MLMRHQEGATHPKPLRKASAVALSEDLTTPNERSYKRARSTSSRVSTLKLFWIYSNIGHFAEVLARLPWLSCICLAVGGAECMNTWMKEHVGEKFKV